MIAVSELAARAISANSRTFLSRFLYNGAEVGGDVRSVTINKGSCGGSVFAPGAVFSSYIDVVIDNCSEALSGKELTYQIGVVIDENTTEWYDIGKYTVHKPSTNVYTTSFTALGRISAKMGMLYQSRLTFPTTIQNVLNEISANTGIEIDASAFDTSGVIEKEISGYMYREAIAIIAGLFFGYATEDASGRVVFANYKNANVIETDGDRTSVLPNFADTDTEITGIKVSAGDISTIDEETGNEVYKEQIFMTGSPNAVADNEHMTQALFDANTGNIIGYSYRPATVSISLGDFRIEPFDCLQVTDSLGVVRTVPCMSIVHRFDGGLITDVTAPELEDGDDSGTAFKGLLTQAIERYQQELISVKTLLAGKISAGEMEATYATIQSLDAVKATVQTLTVENVSIKNNVSANSAAIKSLQTTALTADSAVIKTLQADKLDASAADLKYATITNLNAAVGRIGTLETDYVKTTTLEANYLTSSQIAASYVKTSTLEADYIKAIDIAAKYLTVDSAVIKTLQADKLDASAADLKYATITNLNAAVGRIGTLETDYVKTTTLEANYLTSSQIAASYVKTSTIEADYIKATEIASKYLTADSAVIKTLQTDKLNVSDAAATYLTADSAIIKTLQTDKLNVSDAAATYLTADSAVIKTLQTDKLDASAADLKYATITNLNAAVGRIGTLETDYVKTSTLTANYLTATQISSTYAKTATLEANYVKSSTLEANYITASEIAAKYLTADSVVITSLSTTYANIDFSNISEATMQNFYAKSGLIEDATISNGTLTGNLVGVTISGDLIEANTLVANKLVIQGADGLYYKLNTDGVTTEASQTDYNSLNGSVIKAKSITASKISVTDLVAFGATIGGFHITDSALYSGSKSAVGNTTRGAYLDNTGQIAFGDASNYIKYFKDTDGAYKLVVFAKEFVLSSSGTSVESAINSAQSAANAAGTAASNAQSTANTAKANAATAQSAADAAQSTANTAKADAATAQSAADAAQSTANTAKTNADTAQDTADTALNQSVEYIVGTQTAATNVWTGKTTSTSLYAGKTIAYKLPYAGNSSAATLNLTLAGGTTTGAKNVRRLNSNVTTQYVAGSVVTMTYDGTYWRTTDYDSGNTYDRQRYQQAIKCGTTAIVAANIIVGANGVYKHLKLNTAFDITYPILYASSAIAASATGTNNYISIPFAVQTTQSITLTAYKPVYIKGSLSGKMFTPVSTAPLTQTEPTTEDGYYYILLGTAYSTTNMYLLPEHPIYRYFNGAFKSVEQIAVEASQTATNYLKFDNGLIIGNMTADTLGNNVFIDSDSVEIRSGTTVLASFSATAITLGDAALGYKTIDFLNGPADGEFLTLSAEDIMMEGSSTSSMYVQGSASEHWTYLTMNGHNLFLQAAQYDTGSDGKPVYAGAEITLLGDEDSYLNGSANYINLTGRKGITLTTNTGVVAVNGNLTVGSASMEYSTGYITGTWLKTTANIALSSKASTFAVLSNGWIYSRTAAQVLSDIGAFPLVGGTVTGNMSITGTLEQGGNLVPQATNSVDLGSSSKKWKNVYATTFTGALSGNATSATTLGGLTATITELNYCDGVTSNIQTQLNNKAASDHEHTGIWYGDVENNIGMKIVLASSVYYCRPTDTTNTYNLGGNSFRWSTIYARNEVNVSSDENLKENIEKVPKKYIDMLDELEPVIFKFKNGDRLHCGYISQRVEEAMTKHCITAEEFGGFCKDAKYDADGKIIEGEYDYSLRYGEFISLLHAKIKKLEVLVTELSQKIS